MIEQIRIPADNKFDQLITITLESDKSYQIVADNNAQAKILFQYKNTQDARNEINLVLSERSFVQLFHLQNAAKNVQIATQFSIKQNQDSYCEIFESALGSKSAETNFDVALEEVGATCVMLGVFLADQEQKISNTIVMRHNAPRTHSNQNYKGIAQDNSTGSFFSRVIVEKNAQKISSSQTNKNLLLSKKAIINTKPELEIYADDVKCAHGATVGELDRNALFYLRSRGLSHVQAMTMLTYAFIEENIEHEFKSHIESAIMDKISRADLLGV